MIFLSHLPLKLGQVVKGVNYLNHVVLLIYVIHISYGSKI